MGARGVAVPFCVSRARLWFGDAIRAAGAASAGASFARCSRSFVTPRYGVGAAIRGVDAVARYGAKRGWCHAS
mgnify:CR=1 FL=1